MQPIEILSVALISFAGGFLYSKFQRWVIGKIWPGNIIWERDPSTTWWKAFDRNYKEDDDESKHS